MPQYLRLSTVYRKEKPNTITTQQSCPFCDLSEFKKDQTVLDQKEDMFWIKNKYPTLSQDTYQTVLIETDTCENDLSTYSLEKATSLFRYALFLREKMLKEGSYKDVLLFKNHGYHLGGSIRHAHMQLVGLYEGTQKPKGLISSLQGISIHKDNHLSVNLSTHPLNEGYEFNVLWTKEDVRYVPWIQSLVRFLKQNKTLPPKEDYNLFYYQIEDQRIIKLTQRNIPSAYYIGYQYNLLPSNLEDVVKEFQLFHQHIT